MVYFRLYDEESQKKRKKQSKDKIEHSQEKQQKHFIAKLNQDLIQQQLLGNDHLKHDNSQGISNLPFSVQHFLKHEQQLMLILMDASVEEGKQAIWERFTRLTVGQKRAFLADLYQLDQTQYVLPQQHQWQQWEKTISKLASLPIETEEPYKEARTETAVDPALFYDMKTEDFISPYREIWLWLNYKGNHQGQTPILRQLDQLPLDKKKLIMHKLVAGRRLTATTFASALTIIVYEKAFVDWEKIKMNLQDIEQKTAKQALTELKEIEKHGEAAEDRLSVDEKQEEDKQSGGIFGLIAATSLLTDATDGKKSEQAIWEKWSKSAQDLSLLLLLHPLNTKPKTIKQTDLLSFVDRVLMISTVINAVRRKSKREKQLTLHGFSSPIVFAKTCIEYFARIIYERGVVQHDPQYKKLLVHLGYTRDSLPSQEQLLNKLYLNYLG